MRAKVKVEVEGVIKCPPIGSVIFEIAYGERQRVVLATWNPSENRWDSFVDGHEFIGLQKPKQK